MKKIIIFLLLLISCSQTDMHDVHIGCAPDNGTCNTAKEGERNRDLFSETNATNVETSEVEYFNNVKGYLAKPKTGKHPGVVMIHEWWGLNQNIKDMAVILSNEGFTVLAVDLYEGEVAATPEDARRLTTAVKQERANENLRAAAEYLKNNEKAPKIASMGWCFGGGQSLQLALSGETLDATVIYYGKVTDDKEQLTKVKWPVLGIFAEKDQGIPPASVNAFKTALDELGINNSITIYPNVDHAFANPSGARYAPNETKDAWNKTVSFLKATLS